MRHVQRPPKVLGLLEIRILVAVARGPMTAYQIGQWAEIDAANSLGMGKGGLYTAARRLAETRLLAPAAGQTSNIYSLTRTGVQVLETHLAVLSGIVATGQQRLRLAKQVREEGAGQDGL